ncbi:MAG: hypothetical protein VR72_03025 [Clostridiaceae bacterium BRH_c20a]|nr:MAG: hypothetical protein VR72_03025 [Clostridiaceae bacterium BRH_c20a]
MSWKEWQPPQPGQQEASLNNLQPEQNQTANTDWRNWTPAQQASSSWQNWKPGQSNPQDNVNQEFVQKHPYIYKALQTAGNVLSAPLRALDKVPFIKRAGEQARSRILMDDSQVQTDTGSKFGNVAADITGAALGYLTPLPGGQSLLGTTFQTVGKPVERAVQGVTNSKVLPALARGSAEAGTLAAIEGIARGEKGTELAKRVAIEASLGGVLDAGLTAALPAAVKRVMQRFNGQPTDVLEREVAKDIGVNFDNMNGAQKEAIRKVVRSMQGEATANGRLLYQGQDFTFRDMNHQDRLKQVLPEKPTLLPKGQDFTMVDQPLSFKTKAPNVDFDRTPINNKPISQFDNTFQSQYNNEQEIKRQLAKYYSKFESQEGLDEAAGAIADLQRTENNIRTEGGLSPDINRRHAGVSNKPYKTVGLSFSQDLINTGKVNLTGYKFNDTKDLAVISQAFRDPRLETLRFYYTRGNEIVGTEAISSRLPNASAAFIDDFDNYLRKSQEKMGRLKADGYYLLHNHPTGNPKPSEADISMTQHYAQKLQGFKGHIIINSNKYSAISWNGRNLSGQENLLLDLGEDKLLKPSIQHSLLGTKIGGTDLLAKVAKSMQMNKNVSTVFFTDSQYGIKGILEIDNSMLKSEGYRGFLRNQAREHGGAKVFIVGDSSIEKQLIELTRNGDITDGYIKDINMGIRDRVNPDKAKGDWFGLDAQQEARALRPPKPFEDNTYRIPGFEKPVIPNQDPALLALPPGQNFQTMDPLRFKTQMPRDFEKPMSFKPSEINTEPLIFKKTITAPMQSDITPNLNPDLSLKNELRNEASETAIENLFESRSIKPQMLKSMDEVLSPRNAQRLQDISGSEIYTTDVFRNFRKVFGDNFESVKRAVLDPFDASKARNVEFQKRWTDKLKNEIVDGLGIQKGSKLSKLVQRYGEKTITPEELASLSSDELTRIKKADKWFRLAYDHLLDNVNATRARIYPGNLEKIIPKRQDYYRHFQEITNDIEGLKNIFDTPANIDPKLAGISPFTKPKSKWLSFAQRRTGAGAFTEDAVGGFLNYLPNASYGINIDPHIGQFRNLAKSLADSTENSKNLNNFINFLNQFSNDLSGKTNMMDRVFQDYMGRSLFKSVEWLNKRVKANVILGNFGSALSQLGNIPQGIAYAKQHSISGVKRTIRSIFEPDAAIKQSGFIKERFVDRMFRQFDVSTLDNLRNMAIYMMEQSDRIGTEIIWNSAYEKALAEGIQNPIKQADDITRNLVAGRGIGEVPLGQKSKVIQTLIPFTLEVSNLWKVQKDFVKSKDMGALLTLYSAAFVYNEVMEKVRGTRIVFDPIDALRDAFTEEDLNALERGGRLAGEVLSSLPFGQYIGGAVLDENQREKYFGRNDPTRFGGGLLLSKGLQDPLYKLLPPFGGMQISKTIRGADALTSGGVYSNDGTKLKYPIKDNPTNAVKGLFFGPSGFSETKDYYENDRRPLSENQTKQVEQNPQAYSAIIRKRQIDGIKTKVDEVRKNKNLTFEQKKKEIDKLMQQLQRLRGGQ